MRRFGFGFYIVVGLFSALPSWALYAQDVGGAGQLNLPPLDRKLGVKTREFILLPSLGLSYGYDTNMFYAADNDFEKPFSAQGLWLAPALSIRNRNTKNIKAVMDGKLDLNYYLTDSKAVKEHNAVGGNVGLAVTFFEKSAVALTLRERYRRTLDRRDFETERDFNRHMNRIGGGVLFRPGGRALTLKLDYDFAADLFSDTDEDWGDAIFHDIRFLGTWKFFPYTALVMDVNWQMRKYLADGEGNYGELTDSMPLKARIGVNGFITKKLSVMAMVGYGNSFHSERALPTAAELQVVKDSVGATDAQLPTSDNESFNSVIGEARVSMKFTKATILQAGYQLDFNDSLFSNWVSYHKVYGNFQQRIAKRVDFIADVAYLYMTYAQLPAMFAVKPVVGLLSAFDRTDVILLGQVRAKVDITRWLAFELKYRLEMVNSLNTTTFGTRIQNGDGSLIDDYMEYNRHLVLGTLILRY